MFGFKKVKVDMHSPEYEKLSKQYIGVLEELQSLKIKIKVLETDIHNLRGNFNRKLVGLKKSEVEETTEEESKDINNPVILPTDGTFKIGR